LGNALEIEMAMLGNMCLDIILASSRIFPLGYFYKVLRDINIRVLYYRKHTQSSQSNHCYIAVMRHTVRYLPLWLLRALSLSPLRALWLLKNGILSIVVPKAAVYTAKKIAIE
jgi:hypothetical protein